MLEPMYIEHIYFGVSFDIYPDKHFFFSCQGCAHVWRATFAMHNQMMYNQWCINIKRRFGCFGIIGKHQDNSLWQTEGRFMYTLAYSYSVTRRGMAQCISASLLVLDRWSRPNMTVPSLIPSKDCVNFIYLLYWQQWLIGNVTNVYVRPLPYLVVLDRGLQWPLVEAQSAANDLSFPFWRFIHCMPHLFI